MCKDILYQRDSKIKYLDVEKKDDINYWWGVE